MMPSNAEIMKADQEARAWHYWREKQKPPLNSLTFHRTMQETYGIKWQGIVVKLLLSWMRDKRDSIQYRKYVRSNPSHPLYEDYK